MRIQIDYNTYYFYGETQGVACNKETADLLGIKGINSYTYRLDTYNDYLNLIATKHDITVDEVLAKALNNQDCH